MNYLAHPVFGAVLRDDVMKKRMAIVERRSPQFSDVSSSYSSDTFHLYIFIWPKKLRNSFPPANNGKPPPRPLDNIFTDFPHIYESIFILFTRTRGGDHILHRASLHIIRQSRFSLLYKDFSNYSKILSPVFQIPWCIKLFPIYPFF